MKMAKSIKKKRLTQDQEFQIMKLVLDKFLIIGLLFMIYGIYLALIVGSYGVGISWGVSGAIVWILFAMLLVREYEVLA